MTQTSSRFVLITQPFEERWRAHLQSLAPHLHVEVRQARHLDDIPREMWQHVEILYTLRLLPTPELAPNLHWVQLYSAGADRVLDHPLFHTDTIFSTASGVHTIIGTEYVLMMMLAWFHRLPQLLSWQSKGQWPPNTVRFGPSLLAEELRGKTIGIVGYGSIGREVARLAAAFGMRVLALQRGDDRRDRGFLFPDVGDPLGNVPERYYTFEQLYDLLHVCDVVLAAVPLTEQTRNLFDDAAFRAMKPDAFFVNIARGEVCDEPALIRALQEHTIAGAALDVFSQEPLPVESPLWHLPNVLLSPHVMGLTPHYGERAWMIFEENFRRYLAGEPMLNVVDKQLQY
jgi:phosphoglycerate dehydrogenase-like enzyme